MFAMKNQKKTIKKTAEQVLKLARRKPIAEPPIDVDCGLSTGSTLLNLACSNSPEIGFLPGRYYFLVGDSASGKTFLSLTCFAEACINPVFDEYRLIYDDVEGGNLFDIRKLFGKRVAKRLEPPRIVDGEPVYSDTIEEFYYHIDDQIKEGRPFIYVLDSMDGLSSEQEVEKFQETKDADRKGRQVAGSYGDGKAKMNSARLRQLLSPLRQSGSILIVINQTRDNLGFGFEKKTRSGGHALRFYASLEMWSSIRARWTKTINGKKRQVGVIAQVQIKKNRLTGSGHTIELPIHHTYGIDDIGSCIKFLLEEGRWKKSGAKILPDGLVDKSFDGMTERRLIRHIEENHLEDDLRDLVGEQWMSIESSMDLGRKPRYE